MVHCLASRFPLTESPVGCSSPPLTGQSVQDDKSRWCSSTESSLNAKKDINDSETKGDPVEVADALREEDELCPAKDT